MGEPKALVRLEGEALVRRALRVLEDAGCAPLVVVIGAAARQVRSVLPAGVTVVEEPGWAEGMGTSLRAGLETLAGLVPAPDAALVHLVDLPGVGTAAVRRLRAAATGRDDLVRAAYGGRPAHPVVLGRSHWAGVRAAATGDAGARGYLAGHPALRLVECGDVADPGDVDTPEQLARFRADRATEPGGAGTP